MADALSFSSVQFGYRGEPLFHGFEFRLGDREMTGVLGPNGTGKTTLVRLASGYLRPQSGRILLSERDVKALPARERARRIAVVPQETHLAFNFNVREVVSMGRAPHQGLLGIERSVDQQQVALAMDRTAVGELASRSFHQLSGGERQRVILARALAQEPQILLLDEPTAFLDLKHRLIVYELLTRLNRETGLTLMVVSHDINLVARYCRRVVLLHDGRVVADGTPEEVLVPENIRTVYGVEAKVQTDPVSGHPYVVPVGSGLTS